MLCFYRVHSYVHNAYVRCIDWKRFKNEWWIGIVCAKIFNDWLGNFQYTYDSKPGFNWILDYLFNRAISVHKSIINWAKYCWMWFEGRTGNTGRTGFARRRRSGRFTRSTRGEGRAGNTGSTRAAGSTWKGWATWLCGRRGTGRYPIFQNSRLLSTGNSQIPDWKFQ